MAVIAATMLAGLLALALAEAAARLLRFGEFALYRIGGPARYRMAPSQHGKLRGKIAWHYDRHGMRHGGEIGTLVGATILLGDSVVDGGNQASQDDTIMARLAAITGVAPYPVACHGWALANALEALTALPEWDQAKWLVCVVNAGDFDGYADAASPLSFPVRRPPLLAPWLVRRYLDRRNPAWWPRRRPPHVFRADAEFRTGLVARFAQIADRFQGRVLLVYVPMSPEIQDEAAFCQILAAATPGGQMIDARKAAGWGPDCYADHIHPSARGRSELAQLIAGQLCAADLADVH